MWPDWRIMAGIDASTVTSLGTCKVVMPRSESTIARAGPSAISASMDAVPEDDRVRNLHHRRFQVEREQHAFGFRLCNLGGQKLAQRAHVHHRRVDDLTIFYRHGFAQLDLAPVPGHQLDT